MTDQEYFASPGLSNSMMKDLAVSPLRMWAKHIDPNRVKEEASPEMQVGSALHCAILQPSEFDQRYACEAIAPAGCLRTIGDMRAFLTENGQKPKGTRKEEAIAQVQAFAPKVPIWDVIEEEHYRANLGKVIFPVESWLCISGAVRALLDEPRVVEIIDNPEGRAEVPLFVTDPDTGVKLKGKLDWLAPTFTMDLKTFTQKRGKSIDRSVADSILYESYYRQAYFYGLLRGWPKDFSGEFVIAFVESVPPHEVRIRRLVPKIGGNANLYWLRAQMEVRQMIRTFAECMAKFGTKPWRYAAEIETLTDEEIPQLGYAA